MSATARLLQFVVPLMRLRSLVKGQSLGVRARVCDEAGRILLVRHSYVPGWHYPGGGVEFRETAIDAVRRELQEEAGVAVQSDPRLLGLYRNPEWTTGNHVAFFDAGPWIACPTKWGVEIEEVRFFAPAALPADVHPSIHRRIVEAAGGPIDPLW